ncbi:asparagine synthase (glutamine-hydrolyzing) [Streptomyces sp. MMS24-I29]|uniref:asparagine synthase (glutamine-hydrolyzing) n=1 Tax=Streptomyces sp. MMS24-I29 TaxID=3351480 RepID=UPI003C7A247F
MCGITGWVAYDRDLTHDPDARASLEAMTATLTPRGPDTGGVLLDGPVALGHRRLAVVDVAGGQQPMTVEHNGRTVLVTTYSGEIYNHGELRNELTAKGHTFRTRSDTEVVLHAYLEWGTDFAAHLNGMFASALWDPVGSELILVRDRLGIKPLYFHPTRDGLVFGSEHKAILAHPGLRPVIDADGFAELLSLAKTPGHAVLRGIREVRPGHMIRVRREGIEERRYWELEAREHLDDIPTTVARVRELLDDIVARQLVADVPLCTLLSGGLDSSVITALAARRLEAEGRGPVRSFSVDFVGHTDTFRADSFRGTPDGPYAHALAEHVGAQHTDIVLDTAALMDPAHCAAVQTAHDLPFGFGESDTSLFLLFKAIRDHFAVALSGESADEIFGGYRWFHDPDTMRADTFPWIAAMRAVTRRNFPGLTGGRESLLHPGLLDKIDLDGYRSARYHEALAAVPRLAGESGPERRMRELCHLHLTRYMRTLLDRKDRMSMATGLEVRVPFCDHRLVDYVFNTPWAMKTFDGREKSLLRAACLDVLPRPVAQRVKSPYPSTQDPRYVESLRAGLRAVLADLEAPVRPLLDLPAAAAAANAPGKTFRRRIELVLALDIWLRRSRTELAF